VENSEVRRDLAAIGSAVFFVLAPGVVAGLVPFWLTGWRFADPLPYWAPVRVLGGGFIAAGLFVLVQAFARFVREGMGTPAPVAPPQRLVVGGLYRYVRNPMYLAVLAIIVGQALGLGQLGLLLYAAVVALAFIGFVRGYEEPTLRDKFGAAYDAYRRAVPGWWPRRHPWVPAAGEDPRSPG
jgi:protein-S-isoprenylcysteine O-methyltransferase Ste14